MSQAINDVRAVATQISTETQVGGNTAARVGGGFSKVADALDEAPVIANSLAGDFEITDPNDNVIAIFRNGHIATKNFDSEYIYNAQTHFQGRHVAIVGDSISSFDTYSPPNWRVYYPHSPLTDAKDTWWYKLCTTLGVSYNNCAYSSSLVSGDSTATSVSGGQGECAGCSDVRMAALNRDGKTPNIIIIFLGLNDWAQAVPLGTWDETSAIPAEGVINSFSDAYALMLYKMRSLYKSSRIFCCTIPSTLARATTLPMTNTPNGNTPLKSYNDIIIKVAAVMGCDTIDLAACGFNWLSAAPLSVDSKVHPNAAGHALMYQKILAEITAKY